MPNIIKKADRHRIGYYRLKPARNREGQQHEQVERLMVFISFHSSQATAVKNPRRCKLLRVRILLELAPSTTISNIL